MAYDDDIGDRVRELLGSETDLTEKRMFGGLAFLLGGRMALAASSKGGLMVRVPKDETASLVERDHVSPMVMSGRESRGWVRVDAEGVRTRKQLQAWVTRGVGQARSSPRT